MLLEAVKNAFRIGYNQAKKKNLSKTELFDQTGFYRGRHRSAIWEAYKCGRFEKEVEKTMMGYIKTGEENGK
jgi:hypothetical protein